MRFLSASITTIGTIFLSSACIIITAQVQSQDDYGDYGDYGDDRGYYGGGDQHEGYDDGGYGAGGQQDTLYQDYAERKQAKEYVLSLQLSSHGSLRKSVVCMCVCVFEM